MVTYTMVRPAAGSVFPGAKYVMWLDPWVMAAGFAARPRLGGPDGIYVRLRPPVPAFRSPALRYVVPVCAYGAALVMFRHIPSDWRGACGSGRHSTILWRAATLTRPPPAGVPSSAWEI